MTIERGPEIPARNRIFPGRILVLSGRFSNLPASFASIASIVLKQVREVAGRLKKVISGPVEIS